MVYAKHRICLCECDAQTPLEFWDTNGSFNLGQTTRPSDSQQKPENLSNVEFAAPADHRVKLKEREQKHKYVDLARELKNVEHESDSDTNYN